jgi:hypothetical protein
MENEKIFGQWKKATKGADCPICLDEEMTEPVVIGKCGHAYCFKCAWELVAVRKECAFCRAEVVAPIRIPLADGSVPVFVFLCLA